MFSKFDKADISSKRHNFIEKTKLDYYYYVTAKLDWFWFWIDSGLGIGDLWSGIEDHRFTGTDDAQYIEVQGTEKLWQNSQALPIVAYLINLSIDWDIVSKLGTNEWINKRKK